MKENLCIDKEQMHSKNKSLANASKSSLSILDEQMSNTIVTKHKHTPSQQTKKLEDEFLEPSARTENDEGNKPDNLLELTQEKD